MPKKVNKISIGDYVYARGNTTIYEVCGIREYKTVNQETKEQVVSVVALLWALDGEKNGVTLVENLTKIEKFWSKEDLNFTSMKEVRGEE